MSLLYGERGLKRQACRVEVLGQSVAPFRGAWIETNGIRMKGLPYATILVEVAEML